jgi:hypothetical protein
MIPLTKSHSDLRSLVEYTEYYITENLIVKDNRFNGNDINTKIKLHQIIFAFIQKKVYCVSVFGMNPLHVLI